MQNSSDESLQLWAATYADTSPVTSFSAPHGVPVGWGQILPVAHQPSPGRRAPFEEFCSGKRTDCCPCLSQGLRPGKHLFFIQGLSPRPRAQLPQQGAFIGLEDRMGPSCGDPGGPDSQHLSLALPPRWRLRPACQLPRVPTSEMLPGAPFPAGARVTLTSLLLSFRDPLPIDRPQPPRHVPASSLWGCLGLPGSSSLQGSSCETRGCTRDTACGEGGNPLTRGAGGDGLDADGRRSALRAEVGAVMAVKEDGRQRLLLNRSSIIQI